MKQKLLKSMLLLCVLVGGISSAWADVVTFTPGTDTGATSVTKSGVTCTLTTMNNSEYYQIYGNQSGTFSISSGNITKIEFTCTGSDKNKYGPGNASANVGSYSYSGSTGTWTGSAESVTISSTAQIRMSSLTITYTPAAPAYTITAQSNNDTYGTVSLSGSVITGSPKDGYRYASPAYTVDPANSATVAQDGNAFTVTPSANTTVTINFEAIPSHTATFSVNGVTSSQDFAEGADITFPDDPADIAGKSFVGWVSATIDGTTNDKPEFVTSATMSANDVTYYAVFATKEVGAPVETKTQTLQYDTWSYSGTTTDKTSYRLFGNGSYIESAALDLSKLTKVIVYGGTFGGDSYNSLTIGDGTNTWKSGTVSGKSETGSNTYTEGTALSGTKKLRITATAGNGTTNGLRISKVEIFTNEPSITYSAYCTSVVVTTVETPEISPASGAVASGTEVTITCTTEGASIHYTTDGTDPTSSSTTYDPSNKPTITSNITIKAIGVKDGLNNSEIASVSYTVALPCATPTFSLESGEVAKGTTVEIFTETDGATIYYTTNGSTPTTSDTEYSGAITINAAQTIRAIAVKDGMLNSEVASVSYTIIDYATLPFVWNGGSSSSLTALVGVTASGLGSDYAAGNAPYLVKMDNANDYILIKTNEKPVKVLVDVKMIGGATTSKIKVQESADGSSFSDVEELTISGKQNDVLNLRTSKPFATTTRYVKIIKSVHASGGNIGVGSIIVLDIEDFDVTLNASGYATFAANVPLDFSDDSEFSAWQITGVNGTAITFSQITGTVAAGTGVLLKGTASATVNIPVAASGTDISSTNKLTGITTATDVTAGKYFGLSGNKFVKVNAGTVPTGKALLPVSAVGSGVKEFTFIFDDKETGIRTIEKVSAEEAAQIFDLSGRRLSKMQKGVNIVNGKKILF